MKGVVKYAAGDIHIYHGDINIAMRPPVVIGHEFRGVAVELPVREKL